MARSKLYAEIQVSWWLTYYLFGVVIMSRLIQREPNWKKVMRVVHKAISIKISHCAPKVKIVA